MEGRSKAAGVMATASCHRDIEARCPPSALFSIGFVILKSSKLAQRTGKEADR